MGAKFSQFFRALLEKNPPKWPENWGIFGPHFSSFSKIPLFLGPPVQSLDRTPCQRPSPWRGGGSATRTHLRHSEWVTDRITRQDWLPSSKGHGILVPSTFQRSRIGVSCGASENVAIHLEEASSMAEKRRFSSHLARHLCELALYTVAQPK